MDGYSVFEKAELFEAFQFFILAFRQGYEFFQDIETKTVQPDMLEHGGEFAFAQGFFLADGGEDVFVHVSAFRARGTRPVLNQRVSFEVERGPNGKKRACQVMAVQAVPVAGRPRKQKAPTQWAGASLFAAPAFLVLYFGVAVVWKVPHWVGIGFLILSGVCGAEFAGDRGLAPAGALTSMRRF